MHVEPRPVTRLQTWSALTMVMFHGIGWVGGWGMGTQRHPTRRYPGGQGNHEGGNGKGKKDEPELAAVPGGNAAAGAPAAGPPRYRSASAW